MNLPGLTFGIYPLSPAGTPFGLAVGPEDNYGKAGDDMEHDNWLGFIQKVIERYGSHLASLQITNEPNLSFMEGAKLRNAICR